MDFSGSIIGRIEDAILNTFFEADYMGISYDKLFKLDERNFQGSFKKRIVQIINECIDKDKSISLEVLKIAEKCKGEHEVRLIEIIAQNPLTPKTARDYHAHLAIRRIERSMNAT